MFSIHSPIFCIKHFSVKLSFQFALYIVNISSPFSINLFSIKLFLSAVYKPILYISLPFSSAPFRNTSLLTNSISFVLPFRPLLYRPKNHLKETTKTGVNLQVSKAPYLCRVMSAPIFIWGDIATHQQIQFPNIKT